MAGGACRCRHLPAVPGEVEAVTSVPQPSRVPGPVTVGVRFDVFDQPAVGMSAALSDGLNPIRDNTRKDSKARG